MTQQQNPQSSQLSTTSSQAPAKQSGTLDTKTGKLTRKLLLNMWEPLDEVGKALMGELWRTFYLTTQDAIALSLILQIPGLIGKWILGKSFSDFSVCLRESALGPTRYACFIIVASDFGLWLILGGRIIGRFWADLLDLRKGKGGTGHGSNQP